MPRLDGVALNLLCNALNELAEDLEKPITPGDCRGYRSPLPRRAVIARTKTSAMRYSRYQ